MYDENKQDQQGNPLSSVGNGLHGINSTYNNLQNLNSAFGHSDLLKNAGKDSLNKAAAETAKETAKQAGKEAVKEGTKAAAETAAAGTGVGTAAVAAEKGLKLLSEGSEIITGDLNQGKNNGVFIAIIIFLLFVIFTNSTVTISSWHGSVGASSEGYSEDQYGKSASEGNIITMIQSFFFRFFDVSEEIGEYNNYHPLTESLDKNLKIFKDAFETAYKIAEIETEEIIIEREYDYELTMESFFSNEYPYNNINYAELISIISQKSDYNIENIKWSKFKSLFKNSIFNEKLKYLYCMHIEDAFATISYYNLNGVDIRLHNGESAPSGCEVLTKEVKYGEVILVKYDLKSLYEMLELDPYVLNDHYKKVHNIEMIDTQESMIRFAANEYDLGPLDRTVWDCGIDRNGISAGLKDYYDYLSFLEDPDVMNNLSDSQQALLEAAISKLGTAYSMDFRLQEGYFDCSSFVSYIYRETLGVTFGSYAPVAADICRYLENGNHKLTSSNLQVGDLIFYSSKSNGRYKNITHVAFYAGDGKIIDASSSQGKVVYRDIWGKDQIVSICRPLN